ncbi:MAG: hypothetical protein ACK5YB_04325 [Burkholderiales bacterium]
MNTYFTRRAQPGVLKKSGDIVPTNSLFNGRLTFIFAIDKKAAAGTKYSFRAEITDRAGSGPFDLTVNLEVTEPVESPEREKRSRTSKNKSAVADQPSTPEIKEIDAGPDQLPLEVKRPPNKERLELLLNTSSKYLAEAIQQHSQEEELAVTFVFKYGLALAAMGQIEAIKQTPLWKTNETECLEQVNAATAGLARVIVPICLSLPKNLPKT